LTNDHLGSARVITNQLGQITTRKDYAAFGEELATSERTTNLKYDASETRKGYTGYEKDDEFGLEFAQARYYNAIHGRFTSVDPLTASATIKNPQTFNRYSYVLNSPYKFTDPLGLISQDTGACGQCGNDTYVDGSAFSGRDSSFDWANGDTYYAVIRTSQYTTTAQDGNRQADITTTITESLVTDRNGNVVVSDSNPIVSTTAKSVGTNRIGESDLRSIENIVTTAVKLAIKNNFSIPILLAILKTETQFGIQPNRETGKPAHKISTINPGQFSLQPNGDRAVSASEVGSEQKALEINIGKTMGQWNSDFVQKGKTLNEKFQLYNNEKGKKVAYATKAEGAYNSIKSSFRSDNKVDGSFFSLRRPTVRLFLNNVEYLIVVQNFER
jgi:RHS repeat-associated protein